MFDLDNWQEIWATITRNKTRSVLTGFGVFWGLFMLIMLVGIGNGFKGGIMQQVDGFATNACFFQPGLTGEAYKGYRKGRWWNLNNRDLILLREKARSVEYISPVLFGGTSDKNTVRGHKSGTYPFRGVYPEHFRIETMELLYGRVINDVDVQEKRKVCVIGREVYETLFEVGENPIGQYIRMNGIYFQVIGVVRPLSNISIGGNVEQSVFFPFSTTQQTFSRGDTFHFLACTAKPGIPASVVEEEVKTILRQAHDISPTDTKALWSMNIEKEFRMFWNLFLGVDILIWIVGLGALFSGIIGISNIMLVTVRERMREIGVRRAIGATPMRIMLQIISESFVLTAIAGLGGFLFGVGILALLQQGMASGSDGLFIPPYVSFNLALVAMLILIFSGVVAGIMPAMRALQIKAIDAIRDE